MALNDIAAHSQTQQIRMPSNASPRGGIAPVLHATGRSHHAEADRVELSSDAQEQLHGDEARSDEQPRPTAMSSSEPESGQPTPASSPAPQAATPERQEEQAENKREAATSSETESAATRAAEARSGQVTTEEEQKLAEQTQVEQAATHATELQGEIGELEAGVSRLEHELDDLRSATSKDKRPDLAARIRRTEADLQEQQAALASKRAQLEDARQQMRMNGGSDNVGTNFAAAADQAKMARAQREMALQRECERVGVNVDFIETVARGGQAGLLDMTQADGTPTALRADMDNLQRLIRSKVLA